MNTVDKRIFHLRICLCDKFVRAYHERLDDAVGKRDRIRHDVSDAAVVVKDDLGLGELKSKRTPSLPHSLEAVCEHLHVAEHSDDRTILGGIGFKRLREDPVDLVIAHASVGSDDALVDLAFVCAA